MTHFKHLFKTVITLSLSFSPEIGFSKDESTHFKIIGFYTGFKLNCHFMVYFINVFTTMFTLDVFLNFVAPISIYLSNTIWINHLHWLTHAQRHLLKTVFFLFNNVKNEIVRRIEYQNIEIKLKFVGQVIHTCIFIYVTL